MKFWFVQVSWRGEVYSEIRVTRSEAKSWGVDKLRGLGVRVGEVDWTDTEEWARAEIGPGASILITFREPRAD